MLFAAALAPRKWLPSDPSADQRASIAAWTSGVEKNPPLPPKVIDAASQEWPVSSADDITAIVSINVVHISPWTVCKGIVTGAGRLLTPGGVLYFYGPFMRGGQHTAPTNEAFDSHLRSQNPEWGVRDLDKVNQLAETAGFSLDEVIQMPSNNYSIVFRKT